MKIQVKNFSGIAPRYDRKKLPASSGQTALNCDVSSGSLELFEGISAADCGGTPPSSITPSKIAVPYPPTLTADEIFDPTAVVLVGRLVIDGSYDNTMVMESYQRTSQGYDITFTVTPQSAQLAAWSSFGDQRCRYQYTIDGYTVPSTLDASSWVTEGSIPLYSGTYLYATVQAIKAPGPFASSWTSLGQFTGDFYSTRVSEIVLNLNMHYTVAHNQYLSYRVTFEDDNGREGPPSDVSEQITRRPGDKINITFGGIKTVGTTTPSKIHIYRAEHGDDNKDFYHLATVDYGIATYTDNVAVNAVLGRQLPLYRGVQPPTPLWGNPTDSMTDVIQMPSMYYVGYIDKTVYFSDTKTYNHRWPSDYSITLDYDIVKITNSNDVLIVLTQGPCYAIYGNRPWEHWALELSNRCCVSSDAVAKIGESVYYISPDGLMRVNGRSASLVSKQYFMPSDWRNLTPLTMTLTAQGDRLFAFTSDTNAYNYIFDYDAIGANVIQTDRTTATFTAEQMTWKSREYSFDKEVVFDVGRVLADSYTSIQFRLYRNNIMVWQKAVSNNNAFRLPRFDPHKYWAVEVIAKSTVHEISVAQCEDEFYEKT